MRRLGARGRLALRAGFVALVVAFFAIAVSRQWADFRSDATKLSVPVILGAFVLGLGNIFAAGVAWRVLLADAGSPLPMGAAMRIFFVSQLGKYLPGSVWPLVAQASLGRDHGVPRRRSVVVGLVTMGVSITAGLTIAAVTLPFASPDAARTFWWALLALPFLLAVLYPPVMDRVANLGLRVMRRESLERPFSFRGLGTSFGVQLVSWSLIGMQIAVLAVALGAPAAKAFPLAVGGAALAWSAGLLVVPVPAGLGVREAALVAALAPVLDKGGVLVVVVASRLLMTLGDLFMAGVGVLAYRRERARGLTPQLLPTRTDEPESSQLP